MSRRTFMNAIALSVGGLMLGSVLWGTTKEGLLENNEQQTKFRQPS